MAASKIIYQGVVEFKLFTKSIQVITKHGSPILYMGKEPDEADVDMLCDILDMGAAMQADYVRDALKPRKMPRKMPRT